MDIQWLGHSCFRLRGATATIITDPFAPSLGPPLPRLQGEIVTISHSHPHHSYVDEIDGQPYVIRTPGEYDTEGVYVRGIATPLREEAGEGGRNVVYIIEMEGVTLGHLGDLGQPLPSRQAEELSEVDVLFLPAGGGCTISPAQAAGVVNLLEPRLVIPMHYQIPGLKVELGPVEELLRELSIQEATPQARLSVTATNLPAERRVVLMEQASR